ncbi:hypothetical protein [Thauera sp. 63]|uniref:hypothetical protein n=1 Tax=Thauera sp. 63 TaxID=497321 RepID=UPI0002D07487|nr:hypothetical protein [Thauera sp. 63]ENO80340.1 hypothetical protein C664_01320 [Thauera sp. 63]
MSFFDSGFFDPAFFDTGVSISSLTTTEITQAGARHSITLSNAAAGNLYLAIYPAAAPVPTWDRVSGWSGAPVYADADTSPETSGAYTFVPDSSGLAAGTPYVWYAVWDDGADTVGPVASELFETLVSNDVAGLAVSTAIAGGDLTTGISLVATVGSQAAASVSLATAIALSARSIVASAAAGTIATAIGLAGSAVTRSEAVGDPTTAIRLRGEAKSGSIAIATLPGAAVSLVGSGLVTSFAGSALSTQIRLKGNGEDLAVSFAGGSLTTSIRLFSLAKVESIGRGALEGREAVVPPASRVLRLQYPSRHLALRYPSRILRLTA